MRALATSLLIQFKIDVRDRGTLLTYYLVPLVFYFVMGAVFSSVNPAIKDTLSASMSIFAVTMGAVLGMPAPLVKMRETAVLRCYRVSGIPGWSVLLVQTLSTGLHLLIVSLIIYVTAPLLYRAGWPVSTAKWLLTLLVLLMTSLGLGLLIGVVSRSQSYAMMLSQAVFLPTMMFSGIMFPADMLPEPLRVVSQILPASWLMQSFRSGAYGLDAPYPFATGLIVSGCIGLLALAGSAWRYRRLSA